MVDAFPAPLPTLAGDDPLLGAAVETAVAQTLAEFPSLEQPFRTAISVVAVDESVDPIDFRHGGLAYGQTYYSASLLKVAAMYTAFQLRKQVNELAADIAPASGAALFAAAVATFDDSIAGSVPALAATAGVTRAMIVPKYQQIFAAAAGGAGVLVDFTDTFRTNMRRMIVNSENAAAAECIKALGYGTINGTLRSAGLFFPGSMDGVWLAGTFTGALPAVRIPCVNDVDTAQGTTTFDMANLYAHMLNGTLVDAVSANEISAHLQVTAEAGADPSFMDKTRRPQLPARNFGVTRTKIGKGPLKSGRSVLSEGSVVQHLDSGRNFIVVWQNTFDDDDSVFAMGAVVERAIDLFLAGP